MLRENGRDDTSPPRVLAMMLDRLPLLLLKRCFDSRPKEEELLPKFLLLVVDADLIPRKADPDLVDENARADVATRRTARDLLEIAQQEVLVLPVAAVDLDRRPAAAALETNVILKRPSFDLGSFDFVLLFWGAFFLCFFLPLFAVDNFPVISHFWREDRPLTSHIV